MKNTLTVLLALTWVGCAAEHEPDIRHDQHRPPLIGANTLGVTVPDRGPFNKKIALTFDDGPSATNTRKVIDTLRAHDVPATFFINSKRVSVSTMPLLVEIVADPKFILASHTHSHKNMTKLGRSTQESEIDNTTQAMRDAGLQGKLFMRFPFGAARTSEMGLIADRDYTSVGWHIDSADWCFAAGRGRCKKSTFKHVPDQFRDDMPGLILSQANGSRQGGVLLFHDIHTTTADNLDGIIQRLKDGGFTFTNIDDASTFPALNGQPPPPVNFVGESCTSDNDCNYSGGICVREGFGGSGYCSKTCTRSCPDHGGKPLTRCVNAPDEGGATTLLCAAACESGCAQGSCTNLTSPRSPGNFDVCWH